MKQRGRKSQARQNAALYVVDGDAAPAAASSGPPPPPETLTVRQAEIWTSTIADEGNGLFQTSALQGMLSDYCRHRESIESISKIIGEFKSEWLKVDGGSKRLKELLNMREKETRAAASLATKLRMTNQARYTPQAAKTAHDAARRARPWEE